MPAERRVEQAGHEAPVLPLVFQIRRCGDAPVVLLDLVSVHRIHRLQREIVEQRQAVADDGERSREAADFAGFRPDRRDDLLPLRVASFGRIDGAVPIEKTRLDEPAWNLARPDPARAVSGPEHGQLHGG